MFLAHCDRSRWAPTVYVSGELGFWETPIRELGIPVVLLSGTRIAKMRQFRKACIAQRAKCFFSWSAYTNGFGLALTGLSVRRIGSFRNAPFADLPTRLHRLWSWASMAGTSRIVCNSRETERRIARRGGTRKRVVYVPNAVQVFPPEQVKAWRAKWRAQLGLRDSAVMVLGVGRLSPQKNFHRFVDVIAKVAQKLPVEAVIVGGDFGCLAELQAQVSRLGLQEKVRFIGEVPDARELMGAAEVYLLTSDHEGMPNVILEAMAAGVPCVATGVNGIRDLIDQGATGFVATHNVDDLARHVARLAADADLRRAVGARARDAIRFKYQPERIARQLWNVCE